MDLPVGKVRFKSPVLQIVSGLTVADTRGNLVCLFDPVFARPSIDSARIIPIRTYGVSDTLRFRSILSNQSIDAPKLKRHTEQV